MADKKKHFSVVIIGHVDSGKSTTTGRLIFDSGGVDKRSMEKLEKEAIQNGKGSFKFAYIMDKTARERESGITIESTQTEVHTSKCRVTIIDAPGHRDFIKNMITGTSGADVAILMLPASQGELEVAISRDGSAMEHLTLAKTMGVQRLCICINKMDAVQYAQARYEECKKAGLAMAQKVGFKTNTIAVLPVSGLQGDNLVTATTNMPWYSGWTCEHILPGGKAPISASGKTIVDWFDQVRTNERPVDRILRIPVDGSYKISGHGTVATGRVQSGTLKVGETIRIGPTNIITDVKSIEMHHQGLEKAIPGDSIGFNVKNVPVKDIRRGNVVGHNAVSPPLPCKEMTAQVVVTGTTGSKNKGIFFGYCPIIDVHTAHVTAKCEKIVAKLDKRTGKEIPNLDESQMMSLKVNEVGLVIFVPQTPLVVETFQDVSACGRFAIRDARKTIGVGVVKAVVHETAPGTGKGAAGAKGAAKAEKAGAKGKK